MKNRNVQSLSCYRFELKSKKKTIFVEELILSRQPKVKNQTQKVNLSLLNHLNIFAGNNLTIRDIDSIFCHKFAQYLLKEANIKISSARTYLHKLHAVLQDAVYLEYMPSNPMPPINKLLPKYIPQERSYLSIDEIKILERTRCKHKSTKLAFLFSCYTGLRLSDIETLTWDNIHKCKNFYMLKKIQIKTNHEVSIPLCKQAIDILNQVKRENKKNKNLIFTTYSRTTIYSDLRDWAKQANIKKHITFHVARISFVTISISIGLNLFVISKLCGHKDVKTTQIYARMIDDTYIHAINKLENAFEKTRGKTKKKCLKSILQI